jgi:hypothetical protein
MYGFRAGERLRGLGIAYVQTALDPSDPTNPNRPLYLEAVSESPAAIADALNSGDPYTMGSALQNLLYPQADGGHHLGLMLDSTYASAFTPGWFSSLSPAAQAAVLSGMKGAGFSAQAIQTIQGISPQQLTQQLMAKVTALVGTAAGVVSDGTNVWIVDAYGPNATGMKFTLNSDGSTFTGSDGHQYTAAQVQAELAASNAPIVQQHVDTPVTAAVPGAPSATDPNTPPMGWRLGQWTDGTSGYWGPDGKFYAGQQPWNNPNAIGQALPVSSGSTPPVAQSKTYTNPDGTPTYNGQPYSATDFANPYNNAGTYVAGAPVGPATPGGGTSTAGTLPPAISTTAGPAIIDTGFSPQPAITPTLAVPATVAGISTSTLVLGAAAVGLVLWLSKRKSS